MSWEAPIAFCDRSCSTTDDEKPSPLGARTGVALTAASYAWSIPIRVLASMNIAFTSRHNVAGPTGVIAIAIASSRGTSKLRWRSLAGHPMASLVSNNRFVRCCRTRPFRSTLASCLDDPRASAGHALGSAHRHGRLPRAKPMPERRRHFQMRYREDGHQGIAVLRSRGCCRFALARYGEASNACPNLRSRSRRSVATQSMGL